MNRRTFVSSSFSLALPLGLAGQTAGAPNPEIESARQAALDVLKPTQAQLQHGLELHAASTVVESYGFSPRSAIDGDALRAAIEQGASDAEVQDLREGMMMTRAATDAAEREEYLSAWRAAGVTAILQNAGEEGQDPLRLMKRLARFTFTADTLRPHVTRGVTAADIEDARARRAHCLVMHRQRRSPAPALGTLRAVRNSWLHPHFSPVGHPHDARHYNCRNRAGDGWVP